jgi:3-hexulose-6-phosphate synthase
MELQIALDRIPLERAVAVTGAVAPLADWVEVGTSLVKQYGARGIAEVVAAAGGTPVLADLKTVDDVEFEFSLAYDSGARSATVLALAPEVTLAKAVEVAERRGAEVVVDLMGLDQTAIAAVAARMPRHVVLAPHISKDAQASGGRVADLLGPWAEGRRLALAGGLTAADLAALRDVPDLRVVVGSAVTKADDPVAAVRELRAGAGRDEATVEGDR